jgi:acyl-CoA thioesterase II
MSLPAASLSSRLLPKRADAGYQLTVSRDHCLGPQGGKHMSGGSCHGAMLAALEDATGRQIIQSSCQFIATPTPDTEVNVFVEIMRAGRSVTIAQALMIGANGLAANVIATLGDLGTANAPEAVWRHMPNVPSPKTCARVPFVREDIGDLQSLLDFRLAEQPLSGELKMWVRVHAVKGMATSATLAMLADYLPEALHFNLGRRVGAVSLDNSIRVVASAPCRWLLCHVRLAHVQDHRFHGDITLFNEVGDLLAIGSQSGLVRELA